MRKLLLTAFVSVISTGMPALAVPFVSDDAPRCDSSVNRGAQNALDLHMTKLSNEEIKEYHENFRTSHRERMNNIMNENPDKMLDARIWSSRSNDESARSIKRMNALYSKLDELRRYAVKKYKCLLVLFYEEHKQTKTKEKVDRDNLRNPLYP